MKENFCHQNKNGYYLKWSENPLIEEIVICNPEEYLEYIGSKRCLGINCFSEYGCNLREKSL